MLHTPIIMASANRPSFELFSNNPQFLPSVDRLDRNLVVGGTAATNVFVYYGGKATSSSWPAEVGESLAPTAAGSMAFNQGSPLLGANDDSIWFDGANYYYASNVSYADITTEAFCIEAVIELPEAGTSRCIYNKRESGTIFIEFSRASDNRFYLSFGDGTSTQNGYTGVLYADQGCWYHVLAVYRKGASTYGVKIYVNGVDETVPNRDVSGFGSLTVNNYITVGARYGGVSADRWWTDRMAYLAMFKGNIAATTTDWAAVAQERFQKLTGFWPSRAGGTRVPTVSTRGSLAYLDKLESGVRKLYQVGDEWLRFCHREDDNSDDIKGYLAEDSVQNLCLQSEDMSATWTQLDAGDSFDTDAIAAPNKRITADGLIADSTDGDHGVTQNITLTAVPWTISVFAKVGNKNWLYISDDTVANAYAYFNLSSPAVGTAGAGLIDTYIEDWGGGWVRCGICFTGTAASHTIKIQTADADADKTVTGDGSTVNTYLWGAQAEIAGTQRGMSSYIPTTTAGVTRDYDNLRFKGDDGNLGGVGSTQVGTIACDILLPEVNTAAFFCMLCLNDGGVAADQISFSVSNSDVVDVNIRATGGNDGDSSCTTDVTDNVIHRARVTWKTNDVHTYTDAVEEGSPDTLADIPDNLDRIDIGQNISATGQLRGILANVRIYPFPTLK